MDQEVNKKKSANRKVATYKEAAGITAIRRNGGWQLKKMSARS